MASNIYSILLLSAIALTVTASTNQQKNTVPRFLQFHVHNNTQSTISSLLALQALPPVTSYTRTIRRAMCALPRVLLIMIKINRNQKTLLFQQTNTIEYMENTSEYIQGYLGKFITKS
jgi:hypothetical protein